jgi:hypothetical protein
MTNTGSFSKDLRTYYLSEGFRTDMKNGKWGGSVTLPIEGVPVTLGMDFSENNYNEFRNKIINQTELNISKDFYQTTFSTIPNTNLYDAYVKCVEIVNDKSRTGFIQGTNVETEDIVVFNFYYRPQAPGDAMPVVSSFNVQPEGSVISGGLSVGQTLSAFSFVITCKRDAEKDLILSLQTNRGPYVSKSVAEGALSSSKDLPIGTIVSSLLNFEQFSFTTKNNEKSLDGKTWSSKKSKWAPCDGRSLPDSKYSTISSLPNAPDLRGLFLRGLNDFDPKYTTPPSDLSQLNPDQPGLGKYQKDEFKRHNHNSNAISGGGGSFEEGHGDPNYGGSGATIDFAGNSSETRSKNVSVYYYIKIN